MSESIVSKLATVRKLFSEASTDDPKVISDYGWTLVKALLHNLSDIDTLTARQLLADCLNLPLQRPSKLHSALLTAAIKVSQSYPEFHFATFLKMWGTNNFLPEDKAPQKSSDGKVFPSLNERAARTLAHSLLLHPEDRPLLHPSENRPSLTPENRPSLTPENRPLQQAPSDLASLLSSYALTILPMLVTRIKQANGKDGRKYIFVTLTSPEGLEIETISHTLQPSPLHPLPEGKRHYVNIGQLYDVLVRSKATTTLPISASTSNTPTATVPDASTSGPIAPTPISPSAFSAPTPISATKTTYTLLSSSLSTQRPTDTFPTEIGYIEHIDTAHSHMHIYDSHSRHFVAPVQRFSREREGDFVRFIPIIPISSKFKTAIILTTVPTSSENVTAILRPIRITSINKEKGYATWELINQDTPITEHLSPLQLSQGETSPSFTTGFLSLTTPTTIPISASTFSATVPDASPSGPIPPIPISATVPQASAWANAPTPDASPSGLTINATFRALIYLKRSKDKQKRPFVAKLFPSQ